MKRLLELRKVSVDGSDDLQAAGRNKIMRLWAIATAGLTMGMDDVPAPFAGIENVTVNHYEVMGKNPSAIRRSIDAARPTDPNDGKPVDGLSRWNYQWSWHPDDGGGCRAAPEDISFSATVTIPRLADDAASPKVRERFDRYLQSLMAHEEGHIRYAWDHRGDVAAAINAATCATAGAAARSAVKAIAAHDIAYDKATRHGSTTILPFG